MKYEDLEKEVLRSLKRREREFSRIDKASKQKALLSPPSSGRWISIDEPFTGAWQQDASIELDTVLTFSAVFACIRLISSDIGKLGLKLMRLNAGILEEHESPAFSPVLRKPNHYQTRIKFFVYWVTSKLIHGNTYVLKQRDGRGQVVRMYVLDPTRVNVLISDRGEVFYRLRTDHLVGVGQEVTIPSTEIIHDVHVTPEHPLVGVSPIGASGLAAMQGLKIQSNSTKLFTNMSRPGGILSAPGAISNDTATNLKTQWEAGFGGENMGRVAVLGDGMTFQPITITAVDSQLVEQLRLTGEEVCRAFGVPPYKVGIGPMPAYNNINALDQAYYSQTLQELIENIELLLDEGLELPSAFRTQFNLEDLLRMDADTQTKVMGDRIKAGLLAPNEGRAKLGMRPVIGGDTPYLQQQNFSLEALAKRDAKEDPFSSATPVPEPEEGEEPSDDDIEDQARMFKALVKVA